MVSVYMTQHLLNHAISLHQSGRLSDAIQVYQGLLSADPDNTELIFLSGVANLQFGDYVKAIGFLDRVLEQHPNHVDALINRGIARGKLCALDAALNDFNQALLINPRIAAIYVECGNVFSALGQPIRALHSYEKALTLEPENVSALVNLGLTFNLLNHKDKALHRFQQVVRIAPDDVAAHLNIALLLHNFSRSTEALTHLERVTVLSPNSPEGFVVQGNVLSDLDRYAEALQSYDEAVRIDPNSVEALCNRSNVLCELRRFSEAFHSANSAIEKNPVLAEAHLNRGNALQGLWDFQEAIASYDKAINLDPTLYKAYTNRGNALAALGYFEPALTSHGIALSLDAKYAVAYNNRSQVFAELKNFEAALADGEAAIKLNPNFKILPGEILHNRMIMSLWDNYPAHVSSLVARIENFENVSAPFPIHSLLDDPALLKKCAETYVQNECPSDGALVRAESPRRKAIIRIGYFSSDFGDHPVSHLVIGLLEHHDKSRFEIMAFSLESRQIDRWRSRVINAVDRFIDVCKLDEVAIACLARSLEIDIAIDLNGHTKHARTRIFAHRVAPIQVSYIGFLGTMGAHYYDYLIADAMLVPTKNQAYYTEKIAYLPCYQCNDPKFVASDKKLDRCDLNLPGDAFVFCSFNNNYKITPTVFDSWMRILHQTPGSVLWIYVDNQSAQDNLALEAKKRGIQPERLIYAARMPLEDHLQRLQLADLFLDTYPYNAGATASNALRMGLPILTRAGESFPSRYGASLLEAVGLRELVTYSSDEYESLAIALASNPERLAILRKLLRKNVRQSLLFDAPGFARSMEALYEAMYERSTKNLPPECIWVEQQQGVDII